MEYGKWMMEDLYYAYFRPYFCYYCYSVIFAVNALAAGQSLVTLVADNPKACPS